MKYKINVKKVLKKMSKPVKRQLFKEMEFNRDQDFVMTNLYIKENKQEWVSYNGNLSQTSVTNLHKNCLEQIENIYSNLLYQLEKEGNEDFYKYFG